MLFNTFVLGMRRRHALGLLLFVGLGVGPVCAQREPMPAEVQQHLNAYTAYVNTCVSALDEIRRDFERINLSANAFVDKERPRFDFVGKDPLENKSRFPQNPAALYQNCIASSDMFPAQPRGELNLQAGKFKSTFDEIHRTHGELLAYHASGKYLSEPEMDFLYQKLRRMEVLYFDIQILEVKLDWAITDIRRAYDAPEGAGIVAVAQHDELALVIRSVFKALYDKREQDLRQHYNRLSGILASLGSQKESLLPPAGAVAPAERTALAQAYDEIVAQARRMKTQLDNYYGPAWTAPCPPVYDRMYCLHNDVLLPLYNDPGTGLAPKLNAYRRRGGWKSQDAMLQAPVFLRVLPRFLQAQEPPPLSTEELMRIIEQKRRKHADSVAQAQAQPPPKPQPKLGDPTLEGFAANNLIFLLDVSSSMNKPEKLPLLKKSIEQLLVLMRPEDYLSVIVYSGEAEVVLPPTSAAKKELILQIVNNLRVGGVSALDKGLRLAYETAESYFVAGGNNRIILATDGKFEVDNRTRRAIENGSEKNIALSVYYFGDKEYEATKETLEDLAALGGGRYCYLKAENAEQTLLIEAQSVRKK